MYYYFPGLALAGHRSMSMSRSYGPDRAQGISWYYFLPGRYLCFRARLLTGINQYGLVRPGILGMGRRTSMGTGLGTFVIQTKYKDVIKTTFLV